MGTSGGCGLPGAGQRRGIEQPSPLGVAWCAPGAPAGTILLDGGRSRLGPHRAGRPPGGSLFKLTVAPQITPAFKFSAARPFVRLPLGALVGRVSWPDRGRDGPGRRARHRGRRADGNLVVVAIDLHTRMAEMTSQLKILSPLSGQTWPLERVPIQSSHRSWSGTACRSIRPMPCSSPAATAKSLRCRNRPRGDAAHARGHRSVDARRHRHGDDEGEGFHPRVKPGDRVRDPLIAFDLDFLATHAGACSPRS